MDKDFLQSGWIPRDMKKRKTYVWFDKSGKKYIVDAEFDMEVSLPENIDEYVYAAPT